MRVTNENFNEFEQTINNSNLWAVDTETTGLDVRNNSDYLISISMSNGKDHFYIPFRHKNEEVLSKPFVHKLESLLSNKDLIWHHRKFDMHSLRTLGIEPLNLKGVQYDTMLLFHLWNEEFFSFEMDVLVKTFLKIEGKLDSSQIHKTGQLYGYDVVPHDLMGPYAERDAYLTYKLFEFIWPKIEEQELNKVYIETEMPFTSLLYKIEKRGVGVNIDFAEQKAKVGRGRMSTIIREVKFNPASPKDLKRILIDELKLPILAYTDKGNPSFTKAVMEQYDDILEASNNPVAKLVAEYRGWQKAVTSLYEPILEKVAVDGFIRTNFKQHGTVTGRLSASEPNLQQVPRSSNKKWNGNAKSSFSSGRNGYTLIGWDYSQLELRLAASYGNEHLLLEEFKKPDADPFSVLAPRIFGLLTPETRQETKTFVYANLYGAGVPKIAAQLNRSVEDTQNLYTNYKQSISGIIKASKAVDGLIKKRGYVKYWDGRRRHFRDRRESYKGWNSVCQGGGAQLVKKAMLRCEEFEDENCFMVLQVHDEITFCIRTEMIEHYRPMIEEAMIDWPNLGVTLAVDSKEWK